MLDRFFSLRLMFVAAAAFLDGAILLRSDWNILKNESETERGKKNSEVKNHFLSWEEEKD